MKGLSTQKEKNQDEKQPFGRDHENNVFLESFKRFYFFGTGKLKQVRWRDLKGMGKRLQHSYNPVMFA